MNILDVYEQARGIADPETRRRFLDETCQGDDALRSRVDKMLGIVDVPDSFLGTPVLDRLSGEPPGAAVVAAGGSAEPLAADPMLGAVLGGVTLERLIGQGGMGRIYAGTQASTGGTVAVKVLMPHVVSQGMLRRFEQEIRLLARLRHPGIAQVYGAGTATCAAVRLPYFLMEFIADARPITDYAEANALDTTQRLALFRKVCKAVAHGHELGVIHRDLKPANILVDRFGQPKVIDFGVAKCTDADVTMTTLTTEGGIVGTLKYMSPEQVAGDAAAITPRSDVHALGAILYELLARRLPFEFTHAPPIAVAQVITASDPKPLSSVSRAFRGGLDAIIAMCLEKRPERRYAHAGELDAEIGRHLAGEPVLARRPGRLRGTVRAVAAHKATAALSVAAISVVLATAAWLGPDTEPLSTILATAGTTAPRQKPASESAHAVSAPTVDPPAAPPPLAIAPFDAAEAREHQANWARYLGIDDETTNSIGQKLVVIPAGTYTGQEKKLSVHAFLFGQTEVTQGQWKEVMGTEPWKGQPFTIEDGDAAATFVSWDDAVAFCGKLTARERRDGRIGADQAYRLPTEAEWEFACRAGTTTGFFFGNALTLVGEFAWYGEGSPVNGPTPDGNTADEPYAHAVARKQPNAWGLHDVHGNVWEWCEDFFKQSVNHNRVLRGGSWRSPPGHCASGNRHGHYPTARNCGTGFRVALDPAGATPTKKGATP